jgi:hypothetical protein
MIGLDCLFFEEPKGIHDAIRFADELGLINFERSGRKPATVKPDLSRLLHELEEIVDRLRITIVPQSLLEPLGFQSVLRAD